MEAIRGHAWSVTPVRRQSASDQVTEPRFVGVDGSVPAVDRRRSLVSKPPHGDGHSGIVKYGAKLTSKGIRPLVIEPAVAERLSVLGHVVGNDGVAEAHCFDQRRMSAADLGRLYVSRRMRPQDAVAIAVDRPKETNPSISGGMKAGDVLGGIRGIADNRKRKIGRDARVRLDHHVRVVLGFQPAHVQHVASRLKAETRKGAIVGHALEIRPVREVIRLSAVGAGVVVLDRAGISYEVDGQMCREPRADAVVTPTDHIPFRALPLESVDVQDHATTKQPQEHRGRDVGRVADVDDVRGTCQRVGRSEDRVYDGLEVFRAGRRKPDNLHTAEFVRRLRDISVASVDGHTVATIGHSASKLLGKRLEPAVVRGNAPNAKDRDSQKVVRSMG
jgi:hypothetical protein